MRNIKATVYNILNQVTSIKELSPTHPRDFSTLPTVVYRTTGTGVELNLDNEIETQPTDVTLDIWTADPESAETLGREIEVVMRDNLWRCNYAQEVPNIDKTLIHYVMRFTSIL